MFTNQAEKAKWDAVVLGNTSQQNTFTGLSVQGEDGKVQFKSLGHHVCHGKLSRGSGNVSPNVIEVWTKRAYLNPRVTPEMEMTYYPWLLSESPWAAAFIEKDYKKCVAEGFRLDANLPNNYVASAAVATRWLTEKYNNWVHDRYPLYGKLLAEKIDPLWSFLMANMYYSVKSEKYTFSVQSGHEMIPPFMGMDNLRNLVRGDYSKKEPSFRNNAGYSSIGSTWGAPPVDSMRINILAKGWKVNNDEKADYNVFRRPDLNAGYPNLSFKDLLAVMTKIQEQVYDKAVAA